MGCTATCHGSLQGNGGVGERESREGEKEEGSKTRGTGNAVQS